MDKLASDSVWLGDVTKQIDHLKETSDRHTYRRYKIDMLKCLSNRIEQYSSQCGQCQMFKQDITTLVQDASNLAQMPSKEGRKQYFKSMNNIIGHFQKQHKLVNEGYYIGIGIAIGTSIGVAIGAAMDNVGSGIPIGVGIGVAIGSVLEAKAKKEDRILCHSQERGKTASKRSFAIVGILIALLTAGILAFILLNRSS